MLSDEKLKEMGEAVNNDRKNKSFIYAELDEKVDYAKTSTYGNPLNIMLLTACLINTTIKKLGIPRLEYMHELNKTLKAIRGEE